MSQLPLPGNGPYIDKCQHEIADSKPEEGYDPPLGVPLPCVVFDRKQESRLWRKVDLRLMPMIALMYLLCFMDRGKSMVCHPRRMITYIWDSQGILVRIGSRMLYLSIDSNHFLRKC